MKIKAALNPRIHILFFIGVILFVNISFNSEKIFGKTLFIALPEILMFVYIIYLYWKTISAKTNAILSICIKKNKFLPTLSLIFFSLLFLVQLIVFIFQKENGYNVNYFIMNSTMFLSLVMLSIYYLIFNKLYVSKDAIFYRVELNKKNYNFDHREPMLVLQQKHKYTYYKTIEIIDDNENISKIAKLMFEQNEEINSRVTA